MPEPAKTVSPLLVAVWMLVGVGVLLSNSGATLWLLAGTLIGIIVVMIPAVQIGYQA